jgi:hypothetical protein
MLWWLLLLLLPPQAAHYRMLVDGVWMTGGTAPTFNDKTLRHIVGVPNHIRAWSRKAYLEIGGHLRGLPVGDDYELILRSLLTFPAVYIRHMTYIQVCCFVIQRPGVTASRIAPQLTGLADSASSSISRA